MHDEIMEKAEKRNQLLAARQNVALVTDAAFRKKAAEAIEEKQNRLSQQMEKLEKNRQDTFNNRRARLAHNRFVIFMQKNIFPI